MAISDSDVSEIAAEISKIATGEAAVTALAEVLITMMPCKIDCPVRIAQHANRQDFSRPY